VERRTTIGRINGSNEDATVGFGFPAAVAVGGVEPRLERLACEPAVAAVRVETNAAD
jgi:hypothetical protein